MIDDIDVIRKLKSFIEEFVVSEYDPANGKIGLEKPRPDNKVDLSHDLVKPAVFEGWLPPQGYMDDSGIYFIPGIVIMSDGGIDKDDGAFVNIRIVFATYDMGVTTLQAGIYSTSKDSKGYYDLINLITCTRMKLADFNLTSGRISTNRDFDWNMYEEQKYPYWHGWMTFTCPIASVKQYSNL
jgi:hypothetical protein